MNALKRFAWLLPYVLVAAVSAAIAGGWMQSHYQARIAAMERDKATEITTARREDIRVINAAIGRADTLTQRLQTAENILSKRDLELKHAIASKTTGRACLSGDVVRLLNQSGAKNRGPDLPASTAITAAADGAFATDTDVAEWANNARTQYEICRARLDALIDF